MDKWLEDVTIGLYRRGDPPTGIIHSYSTRPGVADRLEWLTRAMATLGGLEADEGTRQVWFQCRSWHELALRRAFLEACKVNPGEPLEVRPTAVDDPRSTQRIEVESLGSGTYEVRSSRGEADETSRAPAVATGLAKLLELETNPDEPTVVRFSCGAAHDRLTGLLLMRAINVRATLRELEAAATRGVLLAPSAQDAAMNP
jgi:hypothetical protein